MRPTLLSSLSSFERFGRALVAVAIAIAMGGGAGTLVGCAAEASPDGAASGDEDLTSATNPMGLRLVYDDPSGRVTATVKMKPHAGERLVMRIRRGRLSAVDAQSPLDCSPLAEAPPIARPTYAVLTSTARTVYQGPEVDRSLLASVYSQPWIDAHIAPEMMERLSREGADAIVEACIVDHENARVRVQTSIQDVWDAADPNASPALRARNGPGSTAAKHP
jgi:hypothetical protein